MTREAFERPAWSLTDHQVIALIPAGWTGSLAQTMEFAKRIESAIADNENKLLDECKPYLKEGETPEQCIERERRDSNGLLTLLAREKSKAAAVLAALRALVNDHQDIRSKAYQDAVKLLVEIDSGKEL